MIIIIIIIILFLLVVRLPELLQGVMDHVLDEVGLEGGEGRSPLGTDPLQLGSHAGRQLRRAWRHRLYEYGCIQYIS